MRTIKLFNKEDLNVTETTKLVNNVLAMLDNQNNVNDVIDDVENNENSVLLLTNKQTDNLYFTSKFAQTAVQVVTDAIKKAVVRWRYEVQHKDGYIMKWGYEKTFVKGYKGNFVDYINDLEFDYQTADKILNQKAPFPFITGSIAEATLADFKRLYDFVESHKDLKAIAEKNNKIDQIKREIKQREQYEDDNINNNIELADKADLDKEATIKLVNNVLSEIYSERIQREILDDVATNVNSSLLLTHEETNKVYAIHGISSNVVISAVYYFTKAAEAVMNDYFYEYKQVKYHNADINVPDSLVDALNSKENGVKTIKDQQLEKKRFYEEDFKQVTEQVKVTTATDDEADDKADNETFSDNANKKQMKTFTLEELRANENLSQVEAAKKAGINKETWNRIETGESKSPRRTTLIKIARAFNIDVDDIVTREEKDKEKANKDKTVAVQSLELVNYTADQIKNDFVKHAFLYNSAVKLQKFFEINEKRIWININTGAVASDRDFKKRRIDQAILLCNRNQKKSLADELRKMLQYPRWWKCIDHSSNTNDKCSKQIDLIDKALKCITNKDTAKTSADREEELLKKADYNYMMTKTETIHSFYVNAITGSVVTKLAKADKDWIKVELPKFTPAQDYIPLQLLDIAVSQLQSVDDKRKLVKSAIKLINEGYDTYLLDWYPSEFWLADNEKGITDREYKTKEIKKIVNNWEKSGRKYALSLRLSDWGGYVNHCGTNFTDVYVRNLSNHDSQYFNSFTKGTQVHELYEIYLITTAHQLDEEESNSEFHYHLDQYLFERAADKTITLEDIARFIIRHYQYDDYEINYMTNTLATTSLKKQFRKAIDKEKAFK